MSVLCNFPSHNISCWLTNCFATIENVFAASQRVLLTEYLPPTNKSGCVVKKTAIFEHLYNNMKNISILKIDRRSQITLGTQTTRFSVAWTLWRALWRFRQLLMRYWWGDVIHELNNKDHHNKVFKRPENILLDSQRKTVFCQQLPREMRQFLYS